MQQSTLNDESYLDENLERVSSTTNEQSCTHHNNIKPILIHLATMYLTMVRFINRLDAS